MIVPLLLLIVALAAIGHAHLENQMLAKNSQSQSTDTTVDPFLDSIE